MQQVHVRRIKKKWVAVISLLVGGLLGVFVVTGIWSMFPSTMPPFLQKNAESTNTQVIRALERTEEVSLVRLGVTGIASQENNSHLFNIEIPGSNRTKFIQYTFDAKLGFEGKDVTIEKTGDSTYTITVPEFKFIGYDNPEYRVAVENNGMLSFGTAQIDSTEMINEIINNDTKAEYIKSNQDLLKDQAKLFYTSIIMSIDPDVKLTFEYK
ncbi:hypothetical protein [Bifidobacterium canis]|uniref:DUF4230 domain-containing protein n=1 Tax=Bifidobacterium canis TaxID=2610880 RepID=A0A7K1J6G1_9BIFI|nr:hypothetical protein [Bifidobacterium canis]MUH60151.1 hypothetical protein [Bifidobacterium canis]